MKKIFLLCLLSFGMISNTEIWAKSTQQALDKTVAIVNDDIILSSELNQALETTKMQLSQENASTSQPPFKILQKQVLDQLINKKIQLQIAKQTGVEISDNELNTTIERIAKQNHMTLSMLYERINQDGMSTDEYRNEMRDQMTMQKLQQREVASKITITPQEVASFRNSHIWQTSSAKEYHLQDILIPLSDKPSSDEIIKARNHANEVIAKLNQGGNFEQLALLESGSDQALQGGDLGWRKLPEIPSAFAQQVVKMQPKSIAGPIQTPNGFHIIRLAEERGLNAKQTAASRKEIENLLLQQKFEEAVQNWVSKIRSQAFVVINV